MLNSLVMVDTCERSHVMVASKPTGIFNCSALPLRGTSCPLDTGRLVIYYPHAIGLHLKFSRNKKERDTLTTEQITKPEKERKRILTSSVSRSRAPHRCARTRLTQTALTRARDSESDTQSVLRRHRQGPCQRTARQSRGQAVPGRTGRRYELATTHKHRGRFETLHRRGSLATP